MSPKLVIVAAALITAGPVLAAAGGNSGGGSSSGASSASASGGHSSGGGGGGGHGGGGLGGRAAAASAHSAPPAIHGSSHLGTARAAQAVAGKHAGAEYATTRLASTSKTPDMKHHRPFCREPQPGTSVPVYTFVCSSVGDPRYWMPCSDGPRKNRSI
jgi:hypothetical protein